MRKTSKSVLSLLLALSMTVSLLLVNVWATGGNTLTLYNTQTESSYAVSFDSNGRWLTLPKTQGSFLAFLIKTFFGLSNFSDGNIAAWGSVKTPTPDANGVLPGIWYPAGAKVRAEDVAELTDTLYSLHLDSGEHLVRYYPNKGLVRDGGTTILQRASESAKAIDGSRLVAPTGKQLIGWKAAGSNSTVQINIGNDITAGEYYAVWGNTPSYTVAAFTERLREYYSEIQKSSDDTDITRGAAAQALYLAAKLPDTGMAKPEPNDVAWNVESKTSRAIHAVLNAGFMSVHSDGDFDASDKVLETDIKWDRVLAFKNSRYTLIFKAGAEAAATLTIEQQASTDVDMSAYLYLFSPEEGYVQTGWQIVGETETVNLARTESYHGTGGKTYTVRPVWDSVTGGHVAVFNGNIVQHVQPTDQLPLTLGGQTVLAYGTQGTYNYIRDVVMEGKWFLPNNLTAAEVSERAGTGILYALTVPGSSDSYVIYHGTNGFAFKSGTEVMVQAAGFLTLDSEYMTGFEDTEIDQGEGKSNNGYVLLGWSETQGSNTADYKRSGVNYSFPEHQGGKVYHLYPVTKEDTRRKLATPKELQWNRNSDRVELQSTSADGVQTYKYVDYRLMYGSMGWVPGDNDVPRSNYYYELYRRTENGDVLVNNQYVGSLNAIYDWFDTNYFQKTMDEPESGTYYFKVRANGDTNVETGKYKDSDFATSPDWTFVRSEDAQRLPALTNVTLSKAVNNYWGDDPGSIEILKLTWDSPEWISKDESYTYQIAHYFKQTIDAEPTRLGWGAVGATKDIIEREPYTICARDFDGTKNGGHYGGYHGYAVRVLTNDITTEFNSEWSDIKYYYAGENESDILGEALAGIDKTGGAVGKAVEQVAALDTDMIARVLEENTDAVDQLKELEKRVSGREESLVEPDSEAVSDAVKDLVTGDDKMTAVGAGLNAEPGRPVTFAVGDATPESATAFASAFEGVTNTVPFSMKIKNAEGNEITPESGESKLNVPVFLKLPIPESVDPDTLVILHRHDDGIIDRITPTISADKRFATFTVASFSDFALANSAGTSVQSNEVKIVPESSDLAATHCAVYSDTGKMLGIADQKTNGAFIIQCDTEEASYVKLFFLDSNGQPTSNSAKKIIFGG